MTQAIQSLCPTIDDVKNAAARLAGVVTRTPLLRSHALETALGAKRIYIKPECLQRTGSFKFRGGYNAIGMLSDEERGRGVLAFSSGNHAQGVAAAASMLGVKATIVMPEDAPSLKIERTKAWGAEVVLYDRYSQSRDEIAAEILGTTGAVLISPYDYAPVIAGQGTAALEVVEDLAALADAPKKIDAMLLPCGGGGLSAGSALVFEKSFPKASFYVVEPKAFDDATRTLEAGSIQEADVSKKSVCDALLSKSIGTLNFEILRRYAKGGLTVSDKQALQAVAYAFTELKLVVEPGGAVALAALMSGQLELRNKSAVVYLSGGNMDSDMLLRASMMI